MNFSLNVYINGQSEGAFFVNPLADRFPDYLRPEGVQLFGRVMVHVPPQEMAVELEQLMQQARQLEQACLQARNQLYGEALKGDSEQVPLEPDSGALILYPPAIVLLKPQQVSLEDGTTVLYQAGERLLQTGLNSRKYNVEGIWAPFGVLDLPSLPDTDWVAVPADWSSETTDASWPDQVTVQEKIPGAFYNDADAFPGTELYKLTPRPGWVLYSTRPDRLRMGDMIPLCKLNFTKVSLAISEKPL